MATGSTNKSGFKKATNSPEVNKNMKSYSQDPFFVKKSTGSKSAYRQVRPSKKFIEAKVLNPCIIKWSNLF